MKSPGGRNLKSTSLFGGGPIRIRYILLLSLLGIFLICGCNKTPPAENSASSAPPGSRTRARPGIAAAGECTGRASTSTSAHASCGSPRRLLLRRPTQGLHRSKRYNTYGPNLPRPQFKNQ